MILSERYHYNDQEDDQVSPRELADSPHMTLSAFYRSPGDDIPDDLKSQDLKRIKSEKPLVNDMVLADSLSSKYDIPRTIQGFLELPGVGPKMATLAMLLVILFLRFQVLG